MMVYIHIFLRVNACMLTYMYACVYSYICIVYVFVYPFDWYICMYTYEKAVPEAWGSKLNWSVQSCKGSKQSWGQLTNCFRRGEWARERFSGDRRSPDHSVKRVPAGAQQRWRRSWQWPITAVTPLGDSGGWLLSHTGRGTQVADPVQ